jgi:hypothetical protein
MTFIFFRTMHVSSQKCKQTIVIKNEIGKPSTIALPSPEEFLCSLVYLFSFISMNLNKSNIFHGYNVTEFIDFTAKFSINTLIAFLLTIVCKTCVTASTLCFSL